MPVYINNNTKYVSGDQTFLIKSIDPSKPIKMASCQSGKYNGSNNECVEKIYTLHKDNILSYRHYTHGSWYYVHILYQE